MKWTGFQSEVHNSKAISVPFLRACALIRSSTVVVTSSSLPGWRLIQHGGETCYLKWENPVNLL